MTASGHLPADSTQQGDLNYQRFIKTTRSLQPGFVIPACHMFGAATTLAVALVLVFSATWVTYFAGQVLLASAMMHAFVVLHEAGHQTLFRSRWINCVIGHIAGFIAVIPFESWRHIHARHHRYTGWQDLDATTATLVPRALRPWEVFAVNTAWRLWLPLFSTLYRLQNYWLIPRVLAFVEDKSAHRSIRINAIGMLATYATLIWLIGPLVVIVVFGPALLLCWAVQDIVLLSQHTHIPQKLSNDKAVQVVRPFEQAQYSRSLRFPALVSTLFMHFDLHELHHMCPRAPGYLLSRIQWCTPNNVPLTEWVRNAKKLSGVDFLFRNRNDTGAKI